MLSIIKKIKSGKKLLPVLLILSLFFVAGCYGSAPSRGWSGPIVSEDGVLYVGTIEGKVISLDAATGDPLLWETEIGGETSGGFGCSRGFSKPMATYGTPWIYKDSESERTTVYIGGYDGIVYAIDAVTEATSEFDTEDAIIGSPVIADGILFIGSSNGKLYALSASNITNKKWEFETGGKIWATPAVYDGVVYIGSADHRLYAIDIESHKEIWHFQADGAIFSTPYIENDKIYIGACDNKFYAIDVATEAEKQAAIARGEGESAPEKTTDWVFDGADNWFWTTALIHNNEIWVGNLDHNLYVINIEDPSVYEAVLETEGRVRTPPVLVNGWIIIGSEDGNVYSINPEDRSSKPLFSPEESKEAPILAPIYAIGPDSDPENNIPDNENGVIFVHAQDGDHILYAIDAVTGEYFWEPVHTSGD